MLRCNNKIANEKKLLRELQYYFCTARTVQKRDDGVGEDKEKGKKTNEASSRFSL